MPCPCQEDQKRLQQHLEKVQQLRLRQRPRPPQNDPQASRLEEKFRQEQLQPQRS